MRSVGTFWAAIASYVLLSQMAIFGESSALPAAKSKSGGVQIIRVQDPMKPEPSHIYMISGAGSNIAVETYPEGVLLVDSGAGKMDSQVLSAIRSVAQDPAIHYIIDTSADSDHTGGNMGLSKAGNQFVGGNMAAAISDAGVGAEIIAHQTVQDRMSGVMEASKALPEGMWPTTTYETPILKLTTKYHGDAIELLHEPAAHSEGDTVVWFRLGDVLVTGEIFSTENYPVIDIEKGGSINGEIKALNDLLDVAFAYFRMEDGTMIIPARGRISDSTDLAYYRDMVTIIRDRVQYMIDKGKTLQEIKAAKLTLDYDPDYAINEIGYTPDMFIEAVYKSLTAAKKDK